MAEPIKIPDGPIIVLTAKQIIDGLLGDDEMIIDGEGNAITPPPRNYLGGKCPDSDFSAAASLGAGTPDKKGK